jgi:hypothetical protein
MGDFFGSVHAILSWLEENGPHGAHGGRDVHHKHGGRVLIYMCYNRLAWLWECTYTSSFCGHVVRGCG